MATFHRDTRCPKSGLATSCLLLSGRGPGTMPAAFTPGMGFGLGWALVNKPTGVTGMLSPGSYGHGGVFGTQAWIDPHKDLFVILLIQRAGLPNSDASPMRQALQSLAVAALSKSGPG